MVNNSGMPAARSVYLDELTLPAIWKLLRTGGLKAVTVLEPIRPSQRLWLWASKLKSVSVSEANFFAGHLKTELGESVYMSGRRLAGEIALIASKEIVKSTPFLDSLNRKYGRNTVRLYIAKQLHLHIEYWTVRAMVAQTLCPPGRVELWLKRPALFNEGLLINALPGVDLYFYSTTPWGHVRLVAAWALNLAQDLKLISGWGRPKKSLPKIRLERSSVLTMQEDVIRADRSLRGQPHWVDVNEPNHTFDTYIVELRDGENCNEEDALKLTGAGVRVLPTSAFGYAIKEMRKQEVIVMVRRDKRAAVRAVFLVREYSKSFFLLRIAHLLRQAELMAALSLWLNVKVFLIRETYYSFADAMQLVASDVNVTTVAYQYSSMGSISPVMLSTADRLLIFADMYKAIFQADGIGPKEFIPVGYLYDGVARLVRERAKKHRERLKDAGAEFIICYMDESVQDNRWGLVSKADHLGELHALANAVLADSTLGLVTKSQFIRNSPSRLYPGDKIIRAVRSTGRYLELMEGVHRNNVFPTEAALVSDLCIDHKFGGTAALESAVAGVRTLLLNPQGTTTLWDDIYAMADIEYDSLDRILEAIGRFRAGDPESQSLGDWAPILPYFDPYRDGKSADRLRAIVESAIQQRVAA